MKTKFFWGVLSLLTTTLAYAQQPSATNTAPPNGVNAQQNLDALGSPSTGGSNVILSFDTRYKGFINSPYLPESWAKGDLFFNNGTKYSDIDLKLNTYSDEVMVRKRDTGDSIMVDKAAIRHFTLVNEQGQPMLFRKLTDTETKQSGFYQVLHEGSKYTLLAHYKKTILKADFKGAYSADRYYDEFLTSVNYHLVSKNSSEWVKLKTNEKALLKTLNDENGRLKAFIKEQKLNPAKNQQDLVRLIQQADQAGN